MLFGGYVDDDDSISVASLEEYPWYNADWDSDVGGEAQGSSVEA